MKRWVIYGIDDKTKQTITEQAKEYGASIPQYLAMIHDELGVQPGQRNITWSIKINQSIQSRLKKLSGKKKMNISDTINFLLNKSDDIDKIRAQVKAELLQEIEDKLR